MDFSTIDLTPAQQEFAGEVRDTLTGMLTDELRANEREHGHSFDLGMHLALGRKGWLLPERPVAEGGAGLDKVEQRILELELLRQQAPSITAGTTRLVLQAVERFAVPELREEILPKVASGEVRFCLGYTEPDGGSDIAGAKTRAVRDGDEWLINGQKIFTTGAQNAQYTFLITRTDPDLPKHRGLTMFLVPLDTPGIVIQGIRAFSGERTNVVFYSDVRIADKYRLGGVNDGWSVLHGPLDEEHSIGGGSDGLSDVSMGSSFLRHLERALEDAYLWARSATCLDGRSPADDPVVQRRIGEAAMDFEFACCATGPMGRVAGSEALVRNAAALIDLIGPEALLAYGADGAIADGRFDDEHRFAQGTATYGGTVEVFRTIIAQHVLNLPKPAYPGAKVLVSAKGSRS